MHDSYKRNRYCNKSMGSPHLWPNVKTIWNFEPQIRPEMITSHDAKSACFKGSRDVMWCDKFCFFLPIFGRQKSHHVMDASCWVKLHNMNLFHVGSELQVCSLGFWDQSMLQRRTAITAGVIFAFIPSIFRAYPELITGLLAKTLSTKLLLSGLLDWSFVSNNKAVWLVLKKTTNYRKRSNKNKIKSVSRHATTTRRRRHNPTAQHSHETETCHNMKDQ